jgi:hypothetical protein
MSLMELLKTKPEPFLPDTDGMTAEECYKAAHVENEVVSALMDRLTYHRLRAQHFTQAAAKKKGGKV